MQFDKWFSAVLLISFFAIFLFAGCGDDDDDEDAEGGASDDDDDDDNNDDDDDDDDNDDDDDDNDDDNDDDDTVEFEFSLKTYSPSAVLPYLPEFAARDFRLYLGMSAGSIGSQAYIDVLTQAQTLGVPMTICPNFSIGGFSNEDNIDIVEAETNAILDWIETVSTAVDTVSINMELGHPRDQEIQEAWANRDVALVIQLLGETLDRDTYPTSVARFQEIVDALQTRGYEVQITTFPFLLDDIEDGDTDLQDACNTPMTNIDWDRVAPCAYSTEYAHYVGTFDTSPYFVYTYTKSAVELYGDKAMVALGLVHTTGNNGYTEPAQLGADIAAAKAAGARRIEIFKFSGMLQYEDYDFADWADQTLVEPAEPQPYFAIDLARDAAGVIDFILNFMQ